MEVEDVFAALAHWIMLLDKHDQYIRQANIDQQFWERLLLICGDMGCESTKLALFDTNEENYNSGTKAHILHYFGGEAKDNASNMGKCYAKISKAFTVLHNSCAIRLRAIVGSPVSTCSQSSHVQENPVQILAAAAVVKCPVRQFIPTLFMLSDSGPVLATKCATDVPFPKLSSERQECCCKAMGNRVPPGINLFNCILLATDPTEPLVYCTRSVITINVGGATLPKSALDTVSLFLCSESSNWRKSVPFQFQPYSCKKFGGLNFNLVTISEHRPPDEGPVKIQMCTHAVDSDGVSCLPDNLGKFESLLEGDPIPIFHFKDVDTCSVVVTRLDATAQFTIPMYASDFAHSWSNFGMDTRFSSCRWKCELCYAEACQLSVPYDSLQQKPPLRTANSFMNDFLNAKSNGVIRKPNFHYWPTDRIAPHVMHCLNGPFNTIWGKTVQRFAKLIDNGIKRQNNSFIVLQERTNQICTEIQELRAQLKAGALRKQDLQAGVSKARAKLHNAKRGTVGAIRTEISVAQTELNVQEREQIAKQTQLKQKQDCIKQLKVQMKEMDGPIANAFDEALRTLNIQLTIYFSGEFVGPQISKLAHGDCWRGITEHLLKTLNQLKHDGTISGDEHFKGVVLTHRTGLLFKSFFSVYTMLKSMVPKTDAQILEIEGAITIFCSNYRKYVSKVVTPKVHYIEAHFIPFLRKYRSLWMYAEEGIESFHHWLRNFMLATSHVMGVKNKLRMANERLQSYQHVGGNPVMKKLKLEGRIRKPHIRQTRTRLTRQEMWKKGKSAL